MYTGDDVSTLKKTNEELQTQVYYNICFRNLQFSHFAVVIAVDKLKNAFNFYVQSLHYVLNVICLFVYQLLAMVPVSSSYYVELGFEVPVGPCPPQAIPLCGGGMYVAR